MSSKKKFIYLIFISLLFLCGCQKEVALNAHSFTKKMNDKNFVINDITGSYKEYPEIKSVIVAISDTGNFQIEFYELTTDNNAKLFFANNQGIFEQGKNKNSIESSSTIKNKSRYSLTSNGHYQVVSRIRNTVIYVDEEEKDKKEIKKILQYIGY